MKRIAWAALVAVIVTAVWFKVTVVPSVGLDEIGWNTLVDLGIVTGAERR